MSEKKTHVRRRESAPTAQKVRHPWNPDSLAEAILLSRLAGLERTGLSLMRVPPGKDSLAFHVHHREEEWVYVLSGTGVAQLGEDTVDIGPGDFLAFHPGTVAHNLRNTGDEDLVYLMGGEYQEHEIVDFPRDGKRMLRLGEKVEVYPLDSAERLSPEDYSAD